MNKHSPIKTIGALGAVALLPTTAFAHTGVGTTTGFFAGLGHPLGGLDHLLAMVAVGLWAGQQQGRRRWLIPAAFILVLLTGGVLAQMGASLPFVEQGILASVMVAGLLVAGVVRLPAMLCVGITGSFALFHGHAHGVEMPFGAGFAGYAAGFLLASSVLLGAGLLATKAQTLSVTRMGQALGALIAMAGAYLTFA